jgi:uncharacterized OsmC-like protein
MKSYKAVVQTTPAMESGLTEPLDVSFRDGKTSFGHRFAIDAFTGGHLLHLAVAGCVYNDLMRESRARGITLTRVSVTADGGFHGTPCESTGIDYTIDVEGKAGEQELRELVDYVEEIAEIPAALRHGANVRLKHADVASSG